MRVLTTIPQPLDVKGEWVYRLPSLAVTSTYRPTMPRTRCAFGSVALGASSIARSQWIRVLH